MQVFTRLRVGLVLTISDDGIQKMKHIMIDQSKWAMLALLLIALLQTPLSAQATLQGTIVDEAGDPVEKASVWIQTAAPKSGKGYL